MAQFVMSDNKTSQFDLSNKNPDEILVIGAGLPRTGTLSLKSAFTKLYKGKCYHMSEVFQGDQEDLDIWLNAFEGKNSAEDWKNYFKKKGFVTGCDYPFALMWKQLSEVYPNAKVVLSTRDPDTWHKSVTGSIWLFNTLARNSWTFQLMMKMFDMRKNSEKWIRAIEETKGPGMKIGLGAAIEGGPESAKQYFLDWEESVKSTIPAERLLIHRAKDGWKPLCEFLGTPVPDEPYPRVNDTESIKKDVRNLKMMNFTIFYAVPSVLGLLAYYCLA